MSPKTLSVVSLTCLFAVLVGLTILAGCGGSSSGGTTTTTGTPAASLSGTTLVANTLTFSSQAVGTTSAAQTVTVTDSGTATLTFTSIGTGSTIFAPTNTCGTGIGAGGSCTISVTFTPMAAGAASATLTIVDNAGTQTVTLNGTGAVPTVSISPSSLSLTFGSQGIGTSGASQPVTVNNTGTIPLSITSISASTNFSQTNNCGSSVSGGSSCTINVVFTPTASGTLNGTLTITDNANPTQQTVTLTGTGAPASGVSLTLNGVAITSLTFTGVTVNSTSAAQVVTLENTSAATLTFTSITASQYYGETNTCTAPLVTNASCTISVTFTPTTGGTLNGTLTIIDSVGTQTLSLTGTGLSNTVPVSVNFGPNGYLGPPAATSTSETLSYYNGIFTTVTVCAPGTTNCVTIPNVLVDTGSVGLRVLSSGISGLPTQVANLNLPPVIDPVSSYPFYECVQYGDLSYTWGPMAMATVQVGGETASQLPGAAANSGIPIQVIAAGVTPPSTVYLNNTPEPNQCLVYASSQSATGGTNDDNVTNLEANGILGIGTFAQDCGGTCTSEIFEGYPYVVDDNGTYYFQYVPLTYQAWNPVAAFSSTDTNGVSLQLPNIPATGQATATGLLTFGVGTEANNALNGATVYELDTSGNFASATLNGIIYTSTNSGGAFIDSGSDALYVSDETTLGTTDCLVSTYDIGLYCPSSPLTLSLGLSGSNGTSTTVSLPIGNALNLFSANTSFAAFNNLGGDSGTSPATDYFDLGLPFFFNRTVFVGIENTSTTAPNGYWAF